MILKFNRKSKGKSGVIEYILNEREEEGTAIVLRGNPEITRALIKSINRKHKYLSGGLMFAKEEHLDNKQKIEMMDAFEKVLFTGISSEKYNILWVEHSDKERIELNFVVPRITLDTGIDLDLYSHKRDLPLMDMWKNGINTKYKLADPNDPRRSRTMSEREKVARNDGQIVSNRKNLDKTLHLLVEKGEIKSRKQMIELLEKSGYKITRKNEESLSVKHEDIGKKALRLKGGIYSENFIGIESLVEERYRRTTAYDNKVRQRESQLNSSSTYQRYLQTRTDRHQKKYIKEIARCTMIETYENEDKKGAENDRIRELIEESNRRRKERFNRARRRETELSERLERLNHELYTELRKAEQRVHERTQKSRVRMEAIVAEDAERMDAAIEYAGRKSRSFAGRIRELLTELHAGVDNVTELLKRFINKIKNRSSQKEDKAVSIIDKLLEQEKRITEYYDELYPNM